MMCHDLSATTGSTRVARNAGTNDATSDATSSSAPTSTNVIGSRAPTPNRSDAITCASAVSAPTPNTANRALCANAFVTAP